MSTKHHLNPPYAMQNGKTDCPALKYRQAKSCLLLITTVLLVFFALAFAGIASIIIVDSVRLRGEGYTFSRRVNRYKAACQFLWADFKEAISGRGSESSPVEPEIVECPAGPPESAPDHEPESAPESGPGP